MKPNDLSPKRTPTSTSSSAAPLANKEHDTEKGDQSIPPQSDDPNLQSIMNGISVRKQPGDQESVFIVGYESHDDSMNPHNWSKSSRIFATILIALIAFMVGWASSIDSAALKQAAEEFGVSEVAESLATGLYLVGFGVGAFFAGPFSETVGRNPVYIVTM